MNWLLPDEIELTLTVKQLKEWRLKIRQEIEQEFNAQKMRLEK